MGPGRRPTRRDRLRRERRPPTREPLRRRAPPPQTGFRAQRTIRSGERPRSMTTSDATHLAAVPADAPHPPPRGRGGPGLLAGARSAASSTCTSARRPIARRARSRRSRPEDYVVATYRDHGLALAKGMSAARRCMAELLRQEDRVLEGPRRLDALLRQRAQLPRRLRHRRRAHPDRRRARRSPRSTAATAASPSCFFGEGASSDRRLPRGPGARGAVEAADRVHLREQPVLDGHAALRATLAVEDVSMKALAYGMARDRFFADDVAPGRERLAEAVERARTSRRADARRGRDVPLPRPLDERSRQVPHARRSSRSGKKARPAAALAQRLLDSGRPEAGASRRLEDDVEDEIDGRGDASPRSQPRARIEFLGRPRRP